MGFGGETKDYGKNNDLAVRETLRYVDDLLSFVLVDISVVDQHKHIHMFPVWHCFIIGSAVRYVELPPNDVDEELLHDTTRKDARAWK